MAIEPGEVKADCSEVFFCPFKDGGKCSFSESVEFQSIHGSGKEAEWYLLAWNKYMIRTMLFAETYCVNPDLVMKAFVENKPNIIDEEKLEED